MKYQEVVDLKYDYRRATVSIRSAERELGLAEEYEDRERIERWTAELHRRKLYAKSLGRQVINAWKPTEDE